jgi:hypothetical protein
VRRNLCVGLAIALLLTVVAAGQGAAAQDPSVIRCTWIARPQKAPKSGSVVQCSINPPVKRLTRAFADRLFAKGAHLYASKAYGPRFGLPVSAPDRCRISDPGIADCEGEFARVGQAFPKCAQWFQIWLVGLQKAPHGSRALIMMSLAGFCNPPGYVHGLIYGP